MPASEPYHLTRIRDLADAFVTPLDIPQLNFGPTMFGATTPYEEIQIGRELDAREWMITDDALDIYMLMQDEYHEWYAIDSPFGGRVAPITASYQIVRALYPYNIGGLVAGWESEMRDVLRPNISYHWSGKVADKFIKRDREWVVIEAYCHHPDGNEVLFTKRLHVLDFVPRSMRSSKSRPVSTQAAAQKEIDLYTPPVPRPRDWSVWTRDLERHPVSAAHYGDSDTPIGFELVPISRQYSWRRARDHAEYAEKHMYGLPEWTITESIHTDPAAAAKSGLGEPNIASHDPAGALMSLMMLGFVGPGWLRGGDFSYRFIRQIGLEDFVTAKGRVSEKRSEPPFVRLICDVWCENQRGECVIVGKASGLVAQA